MKAVTGNERRSMVVRRYSTSMLTPSMVAVMGGGTVIVAETLWRFCNFCCRYKECSLSIPHLIAVLYEKCVPWMQ